MSDARKEGLKKGLSQLTNTQLKRILDYPNEMIFDDCNYGNGKFCPLAVGVGLDKIENPTNERIVNILESMGFSVYNTRGIKGQFYTSNRKEDLFSAIKEILNERRNGV